MHTTITHEDQIVSTTQVCWDCGSAMIVTAFPDRNAGTMECSNHECEAMADTCEHPVSHLDTDLDRPEYVCDDCGQVVERDYDSMDYDTTDEAYERSTGW